MDTLNEINTLNIIFQDGQETLMPRWFTNQYPYFKDIVDALGEDVEDTDGNIHKYLELNLSGDLAELLTVPVLLFLKRYAYHAVFLYEDDNKIDEDTKVSWFKADMFQTKMIKKYISSDNFDELFNIYLASDYLGNISLCHAITDILIDYMKSNSLIDIFKIQQKFGISPSQSKDEQLKVLEKYNWQD